jgi:hypothetical protein
MKRRVKSKLANRLVRLASVFLAACAAIRAA